jgi:tetratricopeptide (TPR) repeat protein
MNKPREIPRVICETAPTLPSIKVRRPQALSTEADDVPPTSGTIARLRTTTVERLSRRLRGDLDNIVALALRKEAERRYRTVHEFAEDVRRHLASLPVLARPDTWHYRTSRFLRRHTAIAAMSASLVVLLISFAIAMSIQNRRIAEERDTAMEVSKFLEEIFMEPDPGNARGANITAREILEKGAARIATQLNERPAIQAMLMSTIGRVYFNLGEYDPSIAMLEESLRIRQDLLGNEHPDVALNRNELAVSLTRKAEYDRALALLDDALLQNRRLHGDVSAAVAGNLYNLAEVYQATGDASLAERNARESVRIYSALSDAPPVDVAESKSLLARVLQWQNDLDEAERLLREAIDIVEQRLGPDHPLIAYYSQNLATLMQTKGDLDAAEALFHKAIDTTRKVLGEDHSLLGGSLVMLGRLLHQRQRFAAAEDAFRDALRVHRHARGESHPFVGYDMVSLGMLLHDKGQQAEAEENLRGALRIYEESLGPGHQYIASALTELGALLTDDGRAAEGAPLLQRAIDIRRQGLAPDHPLLAATLVVAGYNLTALGHYQEAEKLLLHNYAILQEQSGNKDRRTERARAWIAALYDNWGKSAEAAQYRLDPGASLAGPGTVPPR